MSSRANWSAVLGAGLVVFIALVPFQGLGASPKETPPKTWTVKMRGLLKTLEDLLVDISSDERFNSPKNFKRIEKNAENLAKLAHSLKDTQDSSFSSDPSLKIVAGVFDKEADHAYKTLAWGHRAYAREVLRSMTSYCLACHTRNGSGPSFSNVGLNPKLSGLRPLERADFLAATRQFDRALEEYERVLTEQSSGVTKAFDWEKGVRSGLAVAIRVKADPDRALSIVDRALATPKAPFFIKEQAAAWKQSIVQWKSEAPRQAQTEEGLYAEATRLIAAAKTQQKYPADRSADVLYLRASRVVHDLLGQYPNSARSAEAMYLAGLCYEVLQGLSLWDMHEFYYLGCIERAPHSELASNCYRHYEESVYLGYTGSGGASLPRDVREKLDYLELLSKPEKLIQPKLN